MSPESAAPAEALPAEPAGGTDPERWRDDLWQAVVGSIDAVLRSCYSISEFTDDPACILRLGVSPARAPVALADGTAIATGQTVGTLHFWNEHLPRYVAGGPDLRWAADMRRRLVGSLRALADFVEADPGWREVQAFRAVAALSSRLGVLQLHRVSNRYGFERVAVEFSLARELYAVAERCATWGLTRAYNPAALRRQNFFRPYHELWISRAALLRLHGRSGCREADFAADVS
jgi:hypothetical protein